jgi:hypothetical protein
MPPTGGAGALPPAYVFEDLRGVLLDHANQSRHQPGCRPCPTRASLLAPGEFKEARSRARRRRDKALERPGEPGQDFRVTAQDEIELVLRQYVQHHGLSSLAPKMRRKAKRTMPAKGAFAIKIIEHQDQSMIGKPMVRITLHGPCLG